MPAIIAQNHDLLTILFSLLHAYSATFGQYCVFERACTLVLAELFVFGCRTVTRLALAQGITDEGKLSAFYRLFSLKHFCEELVPPSYLVKSSSIFQPIPRSSPPVTGHKPRDLNRFTVDKRGLEASAYSFTRR